MQLDFKDKVVVVTGSAQGIGKAIAAAFAQSGASVIVSDVQSDKGKATASEIGDSCIFVPCDISKSDQVCSLVKTAVAEYGRLDVMVNNAGINTGLASDRVTADRYPNETWQRMIETNLNGTFYCCKAAASQMVRQGQGCIINIASVAGVVALRLQIGFVAAKAAILKMTEAMACELGPKGIRVNAVSPGSVPVEASAVLLARNDEAFTRFRDGIVSFIPQGRQGTVCEIADAVCFLASDAASYINGGNIVVDGGWTCGFNRDL